MSSHVFGYLKLGIEKIQSFLGFFDNLIKVLVQRVRFSITSSRRSSDMSVNFITCGIDLNPAWPPLSYDMFGGFF